MPTYALNSILPSVNHLPLARTDSERVMLETIPEAHDSATLMMDHYERKNPPRSRKTSEAKTKQTPEKRALIKKGRDLGHQLIEQHQKLVLLAKQKKTVMLGLISPKTVSAKNIDYIDSKFKEDLAEINVLYMGRGTHDDDEKSLDLEDNHACLMRSLQILYEVVDVKILDWLHVGTTKDGSAEPGNLFKLLEAAENNESKEGIAVEREKEQMRPLLRVRVKEYDKMQSWKC